MATAAAVCAKHLLALFGERLVYALLGQPARIIGPAQDIDLALHRRVLQSAKLGAFEPEDPWFVRLKPDRLEGAGHNVALDPKCRNKKTMDDVFGRHHDSDRLVDRNVKCIDLALPARML